MRDLFSNGPKGALLFVTVTLVGVAILVGTEDNEGALLQAAADIERQGKMMNSGNDAVRSVDAPVGFASSNSEVREFASEEDLIDDATGIDPTPEIEAPLVSTEPLIGPNETSAETIAQ